MADAAPWLLVGLGNPGSKYACHRHNVGFMAVERWLERHEALPPAWREKFHGLVASASGSFGRCILLKPQTYMNRSGQSVQAAMAFHQVPIERVIVVHDELDFEFGRVAIKLGGGHGGHNGLRDIIAVTGQRDFARLRIGIGRPPSGRTDVSAWVLSDLSPLERAETPEILERVGEGISAVLDRGIAAAMNAFNATVRAELPPRSS